MVDDWLTTAHNQTRERLKYIKEAFIEITNDELKEKKNKEKVMKSINFKLLKKISTTILLLLFIYVVPSNVLAETNAGVGDVGLGTVGTISPLGVTAVAVGTLTILAVIALTVTDSDSTSQHSTTTHH